MPAQNSVLVKSPANEATARIMMTMELCGSTVHVLTHALHPQVRLKGLQEGLEKDELKAHESCRGQGSACCRGCCF